MTYLHCILKVIDGKSLLPLGPQYSAADAISRSSWSYAASVSSQLPERTVERAREVQASFPST